MRALLVAHDVRGPFTLYAGTREPRKNIERLVAAHAVARVANRRARRPRAGRPERLGRRVDRRGDGVGAGLASVLLKGLYRDAAVVAYVPRAEGWGLPPVEALARGRPGRGEFDDAQRRGQPRGRPRRSARRRLDRRGPRRGTAARATTRPRREAAALGGRADLAQRAPSTTWRAGGESRPRRLGGPGARRRRRALRRRSGAAAASRSGWRPRWSLAATTRRGGAEWSPGASIARSCPTTRARRLAFEAWRLGSERGRARHVDVWHAPHYTMPRRGSTPTVVTIHDLTFFTNPEWHERSKVAFFREPSATRPRHADVLVSVSDFTARQLDELVPVHAPVVVASLGVNLERFTADSSARSRRSFTPTGWPSTSRTCSSSAPSNRERASTCSWTPSSTSRARRDDRALARRPGGVGRSRSSTNARPTPGGVEDPPAGLRRRRGPAGAAAPGAGRRVPLARRGIRPARARGPGLWRDGRHHERDRDGRGRRRHCVARARSATPAPSPTRCRAWSREHGERSSARCARERGRAASPGTRRSASTSRRTSMAADGRHESARHRRARLCGATPARAPGPVRRQARPASIAIVTSPIASACSRCSSARAPEVDLPPGRPDPRGRLVERTPSSSRGST